MRFLAALWLGKLAARLVRLLAPSRGSNISGAVALRICPRFIAHVRGNVASRTVLITGTNGKSTSSTLLVHLLRTAGKRVAFNEEGANQRGGVATTLLKNTTPGGRLTADFLVLEVDERNLVNIQRDLRAATIAVTNVQTDQVQRNGDPDFIVRVIAGAFGPEVTAIVNNDEPRALSLGLSAGRTVTYGVDPRVAQTVKEADWGVTMPCPVCHDALVFTSYVIANVGPFTCPGCGFGSQETTDHLITAHDAAASTFEWRGETLHAAYNNAYFLYCYALALAVASEFGLTPEQLREGFASFVNIKGRFEEFSYKGVPVEYMRIKQENPETLQSALDVIAADPTPKVFLLGLDVVNDFKPYYSNTFYTFDCNLEPLVASPVERYVCFGETICFDVANRLRYAGVEDERIEILDSNDPRAILNSIFSSSVERSRSPEKAYLITWLHQYEELRAVAERGHA